MLRYDDVMNQQREIIYGQRRKVLAGEDISADMPKMLRGEYRFQLPAVPSGDVKG